MDLVHPASRFVLGQTDRAVEWLSALCLLGWATVLALPGDTLASGNLREFLRFGFSEAQLATAFAFVGAARVTALFINGRWPKTPVIRMIGAAAGFTLWGQTAAMLYTTWVNTGVPSTGLPIYTLLALADLLSIFRAAFDARYHRR